jgi:hypothetical protein
MPLRRLDPREIDDLSDVVEERISEKVKEDFRSEMEEVKANFRSQTTLIKSDMIVEIMIALGGLPRHASTEGSYEEIFEYFDVVGSSCEDQNDHVERPIGIRAGHFSSPGSQLKLKHKMEVSS